MRIFRRQIWRRFIFQRFSSVFFLCISCANFYPSNKHQKIQGEKSASSPDLHVWHRPLPRWHPETLHEPANVRVDICHVSLGMQSWAPSMMQSWQMMGFSVRNPKKKTCKKPGCHWNLGRGGSHTQLVENVQMFISWSFKKMGSFIT